MDQIKDLTGNVLDSEQANEIKDEFQPLIDKYGDFFLRILRLVIYFISL